MRVTIVPIDNFVSVDGIGFSTIDLSFIPENVHAVQWHNTSGIVEIKDVETGNMTANHTITELGEYQLAVDRWVIAKQLYDEEVARHMSSVIASPEQLN